jgi:hypothetical protein
MWATTHAVHVGLFGDIQYADWGVLLLLLALTPCGVMNDGANTGIVLCVAKIFGLCSVLATFQHLNFPIEVSKQLP